MSGESGGIPQAERTWLFFNAMATPNHIRGFSFAPGNKPIPLESLDSLSKEITEKRFIWMDIEGVITPDIQTLIATKLEWHPIVMQNIILPNSRPRMTPFEDYSHLILQILPYGKASSNEDRSEELDIVIGNSYIVTFHRQPLEPIDRMVNEISESKYLPKLPDLLLYQLLTSTSESIAPTVSRMEQVLSFLEEEALYRPTQGLLERIVHVRDELFFLHLSLAPQLQVFNDLKSGVSRFISPYARPYFRSLENQFRSQIDDIVIYKEVAQNCLELYRSAITKKTNETIQVLTVVSTPLLVVSFFTGLYGMNVSLPYADHPHIFIWMMGIFILVFVGMLVWFRKKEWF